MAAGIAFGLSILCRPVFAPVAFAIPWLYKLRGRKDWKRAALLLATPVLICVAFVWTRNALLLHRFSPSIMNPGTVFFEGNNPNSHGQSSIYPPLVNAVSQELQNAPDPQHDAYRIVARRATGKNLSVAQVNAYWTSKAVAYLRDHPMRAFYLLRLKFFHVFHQYLWHDLANARNNETRLHQSGIPAFPFAWISAMAFIGMLVLRNRWRDLLVFYLLFFCLLAVMLVFYVSARQHASMVFLFLFFACATLQSLFESERRQAVLTLAAIIGLGFLLFMKTDLMREEDHLWEGSGRSAVMLHQAYGLREAGKLKEASQAAAASAAAAPWYLEIRRPAGLPFSPNGFASEASQLARENDLPEKFDRGYLMLASGQTSAAKTIFTSLIDDHFQPKRDFYQSSELYYYLSQTQLSGNPQKSIEVLEKALERTPGDPWVLADLTLLTGKTIYLDMLFRYFDDLDAHWFLAKEALSLKGKSHEAIQSALYVTQKLPEYRNGWIYLAAALSQAGRWEEAAQSYRHAIAIHPDPVMQEQAIIAIFENIAERRKDDAFALYSYGFVLRQFGHFSEALRVQKDALKLDPENKRIHREIDSLVRLSQ